ncbi:2-methyl-6-phytyl-1,4-hydroquinone methyltransferase [Halomicronema hongdechloris C2206]|uniref:2-phytyl-1,4-naphtoquinone methyltransferase n=1 Tax=Halomicronema hongdechloris C2206 TaxID=1641165 RepID=A0A1Z3HIT1_9CYAN|nr:bifunctional demethylmenaquinone methyltransferase/2-methoxy-6-polyprenyl-1,4-benzoquinol methylase UbiE [Halomicronema hongdechloris]ASC70224.1 2-methyl-6-phytyl-1,4-hydroquinone methyltransferase [Halomicronema hongdechloris C2206]
MVNASSPTAHDIRQIFDSIAPIYDDLNQQLSLGLHRVWKRMTVRWSGAQPGHRCLDVCCGSGDLALLLAEQVGPPGKIYGVDFSAEQLAIAQHRAAHTWACPPIHWYQADAIALPFEDQSFDAITMGYGLRNLTNYLKGLQELRRVLRPGSRAAILDFHHPANPLLRQFQQWYLTTIVVPYAERLGQKHAYAYIVPSLEHFPNGPAQEALAEAAGFSQATHYPIAGGLMGVLVAIR